MAKLSTYVEKLGYEQDILRDYYGHEAEAYAKFFDEYGVMIVNPDLKCRSVHILRRNGDLYDQQAYESHHLGMDDIMTIIDEAELGTDLLARVPHLALITN